MTWQLVVHRRSEASFGGVLVAVMDWKVGLDSLSKGDQRRYKS